MGQNRFFNFAKNYENRQNISKDLKFSISSEISLNLVSLLTSLKLLSLL